MLHFLHRHDPQPEIFDLYAQSIHSLCSTSNVAACLRQFELELLSLLGYAVNFDRVAGTHDDVDPDRNYDYRVEDGPVPVEQTEGPLVFSGATLLAIAARSSMSRRCCVPPIGCCATSLRYHLGGKELKSRKVLLEVHRGRIAATRKTG